MATGFFVFMWNFLLLYMFRKEKLLENGGEIRMENKSSNLMAYVYLLGAVIMWGGNWVAVRYAVQAMSPWVVVTIRSILSAVILLLVVWITKGKKPEVRDIRKFALLGLVGLFGFNFLQYSGLKYTTAINGSLINAATPIIIILLSRIFIQEKLREIQLFGVLISFIGVFWVITKGSWAVIRALELNIGDVLMFMAATCWAIYTVYGKSSTIKYSAISVTAYASLFAAFYFTPFGYIQYRLNPIQNFSWGLMAAIIYVVAVAVIALVAWNKGISMIGPSRGSIFMNLMPIFTLLFAWLFLGETITLHQLFGGIFVIGGVYMTTRPGLSLSRATNK
jgi:drug/metabolite transporter (DMT)-like permease